MPGVRMGRENSRPRTRRRMEKAHRRAALFLPHMFYFIKFDSLYFLLVIFIAIVISPSACH